MADDKIIISIEGDATNITSSIKEIQNRLKDIDKDAKKSGDTLRDSLKPKSLTDLTAGYFLVKEAIGQVTAFANKFKEAIIETAITGERLKKLEGQFDLLASQAGIAGQALREDILKSLNGFVDGSEAVELASQAVVKLGQNAQRIPELFELSARVSKVFGVETTDAFTSISNAIATGNTRQLKSLGLVVDADQAYKDLAKTLGVTSTQLTETQKQYALLDATLAKGNATLKGVTTSVESVEGSYKQLKVSLSEFSDTASIAFSKAFGPSIQALLQDSKRQIDDIGLSIKELSGQKIGVDEKIDLLNNRLKINQDLIVGGGRSEFLFNLRLENEELKNQINALSQAKEARDERQFLTALKTVPKSEIPKADDAQSKDIQDNLLKSELEFQQRLLSIKQQALSLQLQAANNIRDEEAKAAEFDRLTKVQIALEEQQSLINQQTIKQIAVQNELITKQQIHSLLEAEETRHRAALQTINEAADQKKAQTLKAANDLINRQLAVGLSNTIQKTVGALAKGENAIKAFASGILETFGDLAIQLGSFYIAKGFADLALLSADPTAEIATGTALVALGAIIKSFFSSQGASASGGSASVATPDQTSGVNAATELQEKSTKVQIDVQGTVLNPIQVGQQIAQILNDTFDATGTAVTTRTA